MTTVLAPRAFSYATIVVGAIACGRFGFDGVPGSGTGDDARMDDAFDDAPFDAPGDVAGDGPLGMFSTPAVIPGLSLATYVDDDPDLSSDLLELYFVSNRPGGVGNSDIYRSTRASVTAAWEPPAVVTELSSASSDSQPSLCCGDLVIYLASQRAPAQGTDIFRATRTTKTSAWSTPVLVASLSQTTYDAGASATDDELEVIFDTDRGGNGVRELYRATRATTADAWGTPVRIDELVPTMVLNEVEVSHANDNVVVFASARTGGSVGYFDVWMASRPSRADPFGAPVNVTEVNSAGEERDPWLSADGRLIMFATNLTGDHDIYFATR